MGRPVGGVRRVHVIRLLLDTHTFLWLLKGVPELSANARATILDPGNEKFIERGQLVGITIKVGKGNLDLGRPWPEFLAAVENHPRIRLLPIQPAHLLSLSSLPLHHRDPFDRLIVAQALSEKCTLVSRDGQLDAYGVSRLW